MKIIKRIDPENYLFIFHMDEFEDRITNKNLIPIYDKYLREYKDYIVITDRNYGRVYNSLIENNENEALKVWANI